MTDKEIAFIKAAVAFMKSYNSGSGDLLETLDSISNDEKTFDALDAAYNALGPDGVKALLEERECKWRYQRSDVTNYPECGHYGFIQHNYCRKCGKKVEVVR